MSATELLVVEDDRDVRESIGEVLEQEGYAPVLAKTGLDAIQKLKSLPRLPAAILLDLMMPVMDGWEFWSIQQNTAEWAHVPVIIISADTHVAERAKSLRALAYLRKPIDIDELLGILTRVVSGNASGPPLASGPESRGAR